MPPPESTAPKRQMLEPPGSGAVKRSGGWSAVWACAAAALIAPPVLSGGQTAQEAAPAFEVASVKARIAPRGQAILLRGGDSRESAMQMSGTRLTMQGMLSNLIQAAYHLRWFQVSGNSTLPNQSGQDQIYVIDARTPGDKAPPMNQVRLMLQNLLAERFQLKFHREAKNLAAYDLVAEPSGVKLQPAAADEETNTDVKFGEAVGTMRAKYTNMTIPALVVGINPQFDRPVVDRTGLTAGYDFTIEYTPRRGNMVATEADALLGAEDDAKSMAGALAKLGLKVVPAKERVEVYVIDHAEKPSEN
jgi:uncharacterized protein (TIGR03435 family)